MMRTTNKSPTRRLRGSNITTSKMSLFQHHDLEEHCISSIEANNLDKLKQFLASGYHVNSFLRSRQIIWDTNCFTMLSIAAHMGAIEIVNYLIKRNVIINQTDSSRSRTALHWAAASGHFEIAKMLIDAGALVNVQDKNSISPLMLAASTGHLALVRLLIASGAHVNLADRINTTALHYACTRSHAPIARELIASGNISNTNTPFGFCSPLKYLVNDKHYSVAKSLVLAGCDLKGDAKWLRELLKDDSEQEATGQQQQQFRLWLRGYTSSPPRLLDLCRQRVRQHLGDRALASRVSKLPVPRHLCDYLLMKF